MIRLTQKCSIVDRSLAEKKARPLRPADKMEIIDALRNGRPLDLLILISWLAGSKPSGTVLFR